MKNIIIIITICLTSLGAFAQGTSINTTGTPPDPSAILDLSDADKGFLLPLLTTTERDAISSPALGLQIFNTTDTCVQIFMGSTWRNVICNCVLPDIAIASAASDVTKDQFVANWAGTSGATEYELWVDDDSTFGSPVAGYGPKAGLTATGDTITGLTCGSTYYYQVVAINDCGSSVGSNIVTVNTSACFTCGSSITDARDGNTYQTAVIAGHCWMTENLAYLPFVSPPTTYSTSLPYYYVMNYSGTSVSSAKSSGPYSTYGALYNFEAAQTACPPGWHVSTDQEWQDMEMLLGMNPSDAANTGWRGTDQGTKLKATSSDSPAWNGTNTVGFKGTPGGWMSPGGFGNFENAGDYQTENANAWRRLVGGTQVGRFTIPKDYGLSVRCVKD